MSGVPCILESRSDAVKFVFDALRAAGVSIVTAPATSSDGAFTCRRGKNEITLWIDHDEKRPGIDFILMPYPPWSWRPWRWRGDNALFEQLCDAFENQRDAAH